MAENFFCVAVRGPSESSDATVATKPTEHSEVLEAIKEGHIAKVSAENVLEAQDAFRSAYPGRANVQVIAVKEAQWKES